MRLRDWIFTHLSGSGEGDCTPPGAECRLNFGNLDDDGKPYQIATTYNNDGFELWLGTRSRWYTFFQDREARRLAWFILWTWWVKATWFGLKRKLWYWALRKRAEAWDVAQWRRRVT